ncbi:MAG: ZIP family metal transporter, partial [Candidatus Bathyarchaeia archaeon]
KSCPTHTFVYLNLIGDGIHNFLDGMIIAATFLISIELGFTTTLAVVLHEIPQEIGDFGVLIYGGLSRKKALMFNFISAITAIAGALLAYFLADLRSVETFLVPLAAGGFIYIASTDLLPELHKRSNPKDSIVQFIVFLIGLLFMAYFKIAFES